MSGPIKFVNMHASHPFLCALALVLSLAASSCARSECASKPQTSNTPITEGLGVNIHFTDPRPGEMKMIADAGFRWVRMDFKWDLTETVAGKYDFAPYDRLMAAVEPYKIRVLFILDYTNRLYDNGDSPRTEAGRQGFARWAAAAAKHFQGRGIMWEIYNEPNIHVFWRPKPNVADYVKLALAVGKAIREAAPGETMIGPATAGIDFAFLESCFKAGLLEYWSAVSVHPYRQTDPETVAEDYCRLRQLIATYAPPVRTQSGSDGASATTGSAPLVSTRSGSDGASDRALSVPPAVAGGSVAGRSADGDGASAAQANRHIPIISGEWGYSSAWRFMNEEKQGERLARQWLTNAANNVQISIWYDWHDDGEDANEAEHRFGTVSYAYKERVDATGMVYDPKPAYLAAKTLTSFFDGYRFVKRLEVGGATDYVLLFRKENETRIAAWTTSPFAHNITIKFSHPDLAFIPASSSSSAAANVRQFKVISHTGQETAPITAQHDQLVLNLKTAPQYLAF